MVKYPTIPQFKITTSYGGSNYDFINDQFLSGQITRLENGFDTATVWCSDYQAINFLNKMDAGEDITIYFKDASEASWMAVFAGVIRFINAPSSMKGHLLELKCDGAGYGFGDTVCGEEYGVQSRNASLDTIKEILTHATYGIVPNWVNDILGSATSSGHAYTTEVEDIAGAINYIYFPYKPCGKAISDVCDIVQAIKGASAGPHWLITTDGKLIVSTIGNHHAAAVSAGWTNYYGGSQANATLKQDVDFEEFYFQKLTKEANYILYHGRFRKPPDGDAWTENNSASWGTNITGVDGGSTLSDEGSSPSPKVNNYSIEAYGDTNGDPNWSFYYPSSKDLSLNLENAGGVHNIPSISFWVQIDDNIESTQKLNVLALKYVDAADMRDFRTICDNYIPSTNEWFFVDIPLWGQTTEGWLSGNLAGANAMTWADVDCICFVTSSASGVRGKIYIDGLRLNGFVLRGAYESGIGASNKLKLKVITDDVGKDDTLVASDDSGTLARLAYAELLRCKNTPYVGWVKTSLIKDLWPGMLLHVHAKKKWDNSFNINKDVRATRVVHEFSIDKYSTTTHLTDDLTNSNARTSFSSLNKLLADARPEFQDRQASSIKAREIDITQTILEKAY